MKATADVRILVVEDDQFFQRVLQKRLAAEGYQVMTAGDGRDGMKAIVSFEPDLVISDWMMPLVDGLELCQSVKTGLRESAPYFILLTAKGEISDKLLALETGADDYLVKPCDMGELLARVRAGLRIVLLAQDLRRTALESRGASAELAALRSENARLRAQLGLVASGSTPDTPDAAAPAAPAAVVAPAASAMPVRRPPFAA
ncbi:MAG: response regulator [Candidatus Eisenbacteria bacterium]|uniref:Response regulator n=1 Tax=Eiseniibacteriota bacterium TaxID=2212470 RepID=A0A933WAW6_UNCEI|nr:response regulator [Candidatus Eisenbacteria bacterium]